MTILKAAGFRPCIVGRDLIVPLKTRSKKGQLGVDRLVTAYGGFQLYGSPLLVIDFGTAITFDYVSKSGGFEGGLIVPGPEISFQTLTQRAALLPKNTRLPQQALSFIGNDTLACMESGILQGYGAMTEGLIQRFQKQYGKMKVVGTGGFAKTIKPYCPLLKTIDPQLSVKSLLLLSRKFA